MPPIAATAVRPPLTDAELQTIVDRIVAQFNPRRIFVFGSYARGDWHPDSDLDLMVEMETNLAPAARRFALRKTLVHQPCGVDILAYTPEEVEERRDSCGSIVRTILREGRVIYERPRQQI